MVSKKATHASNHTLLNRLSQNSVDNRSYSDIGNLENLDVSTVAGNHSTYYASKDHNQHQ